MGGPSGIGLIGKDALASVARKPPDGEDELLFTRNVDATTGLRSALLHLYQSAMQA